MTEPGADGRGPEHVIVIGAGLAGLGAAVSLAERGVRVTVLETRQRLGGRATSFDDSRSGVRIDNCQHVALGCCTNYRRFLDRLGLGDALRWYSETHWLEPGGRHSVTKPAPLPAPLHGATLLLSARFLTLRDRLAIGRAMLEAAREDRAALAPEPFSAWLDRHDQSSEARSRFWEPLMVSACNASIDVVDQQVALHVLQEGFLATRWSSMMGVPRVPLADLYDPARAIIEGAGGQILTGTGVVRADARSVETRHGDSYGADRVICAVPFERLRAVLGDDAVDRDSDLVKTDDLSHSPILGVHLTFDRPVLRYPHAVLVDQGTQWLFRKDTEGRVIHAVISGADEWVGLDERAIIDRVLCDIRTCIPDAASASVESFRAVKEKRATFAPTPQARALRPSPITKSGVVLAGCYVQTGWPSTMESAVRSGAMAAAIVCDLPADAILSPSLRPAPLAALLASA